MAPRDVSKPPLLPGPTTANHTASGNPASDAPPPGSQGSVSTMGFGPGNTAGFASNLPSVTLPKGGGAIRGIDEKMKINPSSGSCALTIPIGVSKARTDAATPSLNLSYDSSAGNGPFGLGWGISVPSITRKTAKGVPRYFDSDDSQDDVFVYSGAEDLVPRLVQQSTGSSVWTVDEAIRGDYLVRRYLPRIEGSFFQIERFTNTSDFRDTFWRTRTGDNLEQIFGRDMESRICDEDGRIYSWLLSHCSDRYGNAVQYTYKPEDSVAVDIAGPSEKNRTDVIRSRNRYLHSVKYGNLEPHCREEIPTPSSSLTTFTVSSPVTSAIASSPWMFEVVFDYGEGIPSDPANITTPWACREDSFSTYRAGFEIRTYRLCRRILMFHRFPHELGETSYLVGSTSLEYTKSPVASLLSKVSSFGHAFENGTYCSVPRPALSLSYTTPPKLDDLAVKDSEAPFALSGNQYQWIDLDSEGLPGVLCEQAGSWFYRRNLSANNTVDSSGAAPHFGPLELISSWPAVGQNSAGTQFTDLEGTGEVDLVVVDSAEGIRGFYERTTADGWTQFHPFPSWPNIDLSQPNMKFVDLTGDGRADILVTEEEAFTWYQSLGKDGYDQARQTFNGLDEEKGPKLVFEDGSQSIYLADFSGDGLHDLIRIRNGDISYWPSLGYGQFGEKVTMDNAPWFDSVDQFTHQRLRLCDLYGSGTIDLIYLPAEGGVDIYLNQAGNGWSEKQRLDVFPKVDMISFVSTVDLLGNGCACLVWTNPYTTVGQSMRYLDFTQGTKPYLLEGYTNDLGLETKVTYSPSTRFYLDAKQTGKPWATRLPFPVHCVEKMERFDHVSKSYSSTRYAFHDGFYDRAEKEFRGFGVVEQWDTVGGSNLVSFPTATNMEDENLVAPTRQKTWFHTGAKMLSSGDPSHRSAADYFGPAPLVPASVLPNPVSGDDYLGALRSLKGRILREEFYEEDRPGTEDRPFRTVPFQVREKNYSVKIIQPGSSRDHAVYLVTERESITISREHNPDDPRIMHTLGLEHDEYGNVLKSVNIAYGRKPAPHSDSVTAMVQQQKQIIYSKRGYTNDIDLHNARVIPQICSARDYHVTGINPTEPLGIFSFLQWEEGSFQVLEVDAQEIPYESTASLSVVQKRLIAGSDAQYLKDDLTGLLDRGTIESLMLPGMSYKLALTGGLVAAVYQGLNVPPVVDLLSKQGGYVKIDNNWWISSVLQSFGVAVPDLINVRKHFFKHKTFVDPFGQATLLEYDNYDLLPAKVTDPLGNVIAAVNSYVHLQAKCIMDANGNQTEVMQNPVGEVVGTAIRGKKGEPQGDSLDSFNWVVTDQQKSAFLANPNENTAAKLLGTASTRTIMFYNFSPRTTVPSCLATIERVTHHNSPPPPDATSKFYVSFTYLDGLGHTIQVKKQAYEGHTSQVGTQAQRWLGSGWTVWNNKGLVVSQYEPFFDTTHEFVSEAKHGSSAVSTFYDHLGRPVCTFVPDGTWTKVIHDSWQTTAYDASDVLKFDPATDPDVGSFYRGWKRSHPEWVTWYVARTETAVAPQEMAAAVRTEAHHNTPTVTHIDSVGREIVQVLANGPAVFYSTRNNFDVAGNLRGVTDAQGREVVRAVFDMSGQVLHRSTMDFGQERFLKDVAGRVLLRWQDQDIRIRTVYDALRRPVESYTLNLGQEEILLERREYGEQFSYANGKNLHGRLHKLYDQSGLVSIEYNFKGNPYYTRRQFMKDHRSGINWANQEDDLSCLEVVSFTKWISFDALNRETEHAFLEPDMFSSRVTYAYNSLSHVSSIDTLLPQPARDETPRWAFGVVSTDYDPLGRKTAISYANKTTTKYEYDPLNLNLKRVLTVRGPNTLLQDLRYTYNPRHHITTIQDKAQQDLYFRNTQVAAVRDYTYDAVNRLVKSSGREAPGGPVILDQRGGNPVSSYTEMYTYDSTGNILSMRHDSSDKKIPGWTRQYMYTERSPLQPDKFSNRLSRTTVNKVGESYKYDTHGNLTSRPRQQVLNWDSQNRLRMASTQRTTGETVQGGTYYVYDSTGNRVRKATEGQNTLSQVLTETRYLGGYEIVRTFHPSGELLTERRTLAVGPEPVCRVETEWNQATGTQSPVFRYHLRDHIGSITAELDIVGLVLAYFEYSAFGNAVYSACANSDLILKPYRFSGKEQDETDLYYFGARYYDAVLGRWTAPDPIGLGDGLNVYCYVRCNPVMLVDPDGMMGKKTVHTVQRAAPRNETEGQKKQRLHDTYKRLENNALNKLGIPSKPHEIIWVPGNHSFFNIPGLEDIRRNLGTGVQTVQQRNSRLVQLERMEGLINPVMRGRVQAGRVYDDNDRGHVVRIALWQTVLARLINTRTEVQRIVPAPDAQLPGQMVAPALAGPAAGPPPAPVPAGPWVAGQGIAVPVAPAVANLAPVVAQPVLPKVWTGWGPTN